MGDAADAGLTAGPVPVWTVIGESVLGASHARDGRPNQDAFLADTLADGTALMAVADGHGGALHCRSDRGSRFAVECALAVMRTWREQGGFDHFSHQFPTSLATAWRERVAADLAGDPLTRAEVPVAGLPPGRGADALLADPVLAYGTTVLAAVVRADRIWFAQLGDGDCLVVDEGGCVSRPVPVDDTLAGNMTTSLCQQDAATQFRTAQIVAPVAGTPVRARLVLLSTDGYANAFNSDRDFLQIGGDYLNWLDEQGTAAIARQLPAVLTEATQQGSGDDVTLLMAYAAKRPLAADAASPSAGERRVAKAGASGGASSEWAASAPAPAPSPAPAPAPVSAPSRAPTWMWAWAVLATVVAVLAIGWPVLQPWLNRSGSPVTEPPRPTEVIGTGGVRGAGKAAADVAPDPDQSANSGSGVRRSPRGEPARDRNQGKADADGRADRGQP